MKKEKILSVLLITTTLGTSLISIPTQNVLAKEKNDIATEIDNGFLMEYTSVENGTNIYYKERFENGVTYTKKYISEDGELKLIEELITKFNPQFDNMGNIIKLTAEIHNISNNTVINETVFETNNQESVLRSRRAAPKRVYPLDRTYIFNHSSTGHLGFSRLTKAAVAGAITTVITGGTLLAGSIAGIATLIVDGGYSNLYYEQQTFYPTKASGRGKPIWKEMTRYYYDVNRKNQCGDTIYTSSTILN